MLKQPKIGDMIYVMDGREDRPLLREFIMSTKKGEVIVESDFGWLTWRYWGWTEEEVLAKVKRLT